MLFSVYMSLLFFEYATIHGERRVCATDIVKQPLFVHTQFLISPSPFHSPHRHSSLLNLPLTSTHPWTNFWSHPMKTRCVS
jgi:hypothetical protein